MTIAEGSGGRFTVNQKTQLPLSITGTAALRMAMVESEGYEMTRAGRRMALGYSAAPTGIAPVTAIPTTAAQWTIFNNETAGTGAAYVIDSLGMHLYSGTAAAGVVVVAALYTLPVNTGSSATGVAVQNLSNGARASKAIIKSGVTLTTPAAPVWFHVAKSDSANTGVGSVMATSMDWKGRIIIPPQQGLALATLSGAGTSPLFIPVATWFEVESDLE